METLEPRRLLAAQLTDHDTRSLDLAATLSDILAGFNLSALRATAVGDGVFRHAPTISPSGRLEYTLEDRSDVPQPATIQIWAGSPQCVVTSLVVHQGGKSVAGDLPRETSDVVPPLVAASSVPPSYSCNPDEVVWIELSDGTRIPSCEFGGGNGTIGPWLRTTVTEENFRRVYVLGNPPADVMDRLPPIRSTLDAGTDLIDETIIVGRLAAPVRDVDGPIQLVADVNASPKHAPSFHFGSLINRGDFPDVTLYQAELKLADESFDGLDLSLDILDGQVGRLSHVVGMFDGIDFDHYVGTVELLIGSEGHALVEGLPMHPIDPTPGFALVGEVRGKSTVTTRTSPGPRVAPWPHFEQTPYRLDVSSEMRSVPKRFDPDTGDFLGVGESGLRTWTRDVGSNVTRTGDPEDSNPAENGLPDDLTRIDAPVSHFFRFSVPVVLTLTDGTLDPPADTTPQFVSSPIITAVAGDDYRYDADAVDPDGDTLVYSLTQAPAGMTITVDAGLIEWTPPVGSSANTVVTVRASDPAGNFDEQTFALEILRPDMNRPPIITLGDNVDAYQGQVHTHRIEVIDPDGHATDLVIADNAAGKVIHRVDDQTYQLTWTPGSEHRAEVEAIGLVAMDEHGEASEATLEVYVHADPENRPPVITSRPKMRIERTGNRSSAMGGVTVASPSEQTGESVLTLGLEDQQTATASIDFSLGTAPPLVDVMLLLDDSGSFEARNASLQATFPDLVDELLADPRFADTDFGFGVSRFEDFHEIKFNTPNRRLPFMLNQAILETDSPRFDDVLASALRRHNAGDGLDPPESVFEALFQLATGAGYAHPGVGDPGNGQAGNMSAQKPGAIEDQDQSSHVPQSYFVDDGVTTFAFEPVIEAGLRLVDVTGQAPVPAPPDGSVGQRTILLDDSMRATVMQHTVDDGETLIISGLTEILPADVKVYAPSGAPLSPIDHGPGSVTYQFGLAGTYAVVFDRDPPLIADIANADAGAPHPDYAEILEPVRMKAVDQTISFQRSQSGAVFDPSAATPLELGNFQPVVLNDAGDTRLLSFRLDRPTHLALSFKGATGNTTWRLLDSLGNRVRQSDSLVDRQWLTFANPFNAEIVGKQDAHGHAPTARAGLVPAGDYFLQLAGGSTAGADFRVRVMAPSVSAARVGLDENHAFHLSEIEPRVFATLAAVAGQDIHFEVQSDPASPAFLRLYSPSGERIYRQGPTDAPRPVRLPSDGEYMIEIEQTDFGSGHGMEPVRLLIHDIGRGERPTFSDRNIEFTTPIISQLTPQQADRYALDIPAESQLYFDGMWASGRGRVDYHDAAGDVQFSLLSSELNWMTSRQSFDRSAYFTLEATDLVADVPEDRVGGGGFRPGALPVILLATDTGSRYALDLDVRGCAVRTIQGVDGVSSALDSLIGTNYVNWESPTATCAAPDAAFDYFNANGHVGPFSTGFLENGMTIATVQDAISGLVDRGAMVIGLGESRVNEPRIPRQPLTEIARLTGAVNRGDESIASGDPTSGDDIAPGDPLYVELYESETDQQDFTTAIRRAIDAALTTVGYDVDVAIHADPSIASLNPFTEQRFTITPGQYHTVDLEFRGDGGAHQFNIDFLRAGTGVVLGRMPVSINHSYLHDVDAVDPDGDELTYELVGQNHGATIDPVTGEMYWLPPAVEDDVFEFTVRVRDGRGGVATQTWTVEPLAPDAANQPPTLDAIADHVVVAGRQWELNVLAEDPDDDGLRYELRPGPGGPLPPDGMTIDPQSGRIRWTPAAIDVGQVFPIRVGVSDGRGGEDVADFQLDVRRIAGFANGKPRFTSLPSHVALVDQDFRYEIGVVDPDDDHLSLTLLNAPEGMVLDPSARVIGWRPTEDDLGRHRVVIRAADDGGSSTLQRFELLVSTANTPPSITGEPATRVLAEQPWTYTPSLEDANGDEVTLRLVRGPATMRITGGQLQWTPSDRGEYDIEISAEDGRGGESRQRFTVTVFGTDETTKLLPPPVVTSQAVGPAIIGQPWSYEVQTESPTGEPVDFQLISGPAGMWIEPHPTHADRATIRWTPASLAGNYHVELRASLAADHDVGSRQTFQLPVTLENQPPVIRSIPYDARVGDPWTYRVDAADPENDKLTIRLSDAPEGMTLDAEGMIRWTPSYIDFSLGRYDRFSNPARDTDPLVTVIIEDEFGGRVEDALFAVVHPPVFHDLPDDDPNRLAPRVRNVPTGPLYAGVPWTHTLDVVNPGGDLDDLTFRFDHAVKNGVEMFSGFGDVQISDGGQITIMMPEQDLAPEDYDQPIFEYWFDITNGQGLTRQYGVTVRFSRSRFWPEFQNAPESPPAATQTDWSFQPQWIDADGSPVTASLAPGSVGTIDGNATVTLASPPDAHAVLPLIVRISDGDELADGTEIARTQATTLIVGEARDGVRPVFTTNPPVAVEVGQTFQYQPRAITPQGDELLVQWVSGAPGMLHSEGEILWSPTEIGNHEVVLRAQHGDAATEQRFTVSAVAPYRLNEPPTFTSTPLVFGQRDVPYSHRVTAQDVNGDELNFTLVAAPDWLSMTAGGHLSGTPTSGGTFTVVVRVHELGSDGDELHADQAFTLLVDSNADPVITSTPPQPPAVLIGQNDFIYPVTADDPNDQDDLRFTFVLDRGPEGMVLEPFTGRLTFQTDDPSLRGRHPVSISVIDPHGGRATQSFEVQVLDPDHDSAPVFISRLRTSLVVGWPYELPLRASDADGDPVSFTLVDGPDGAVLSGDVLTYTPPPETLGQSVTFEILATSARDGLTSIQIGQVDITALPQNASPVLNSDPVVAATADVEYEYRAAASDADQDAVFWSLATAPHGMTVDPRSGVVRYTPSVEDVGVHEVDLIVADGFGGFDTQSFELTVRAANLPPRIHSTLPRFVAQGSFATTIIATDLEDHVPLEFGFITAAGQWTQTVHGITADRWNGQLVWDNQVPHGAVRGGRMAVRDALGGTTEHAFRMISYDASMNRPPTFPQPLPDYWIIDDRTQLSFAASDADDDALAYSLRNPPAGMTIDAQTGTLFWTPTVDQTGWHQITVEAFDGEFTATTTKLVEVRRNSVPVVTDHAPVQTVGGRTFQTQMVATDADQDPLVYSAIVQGVPDPGDFTIDSRSGAIDWTLPLGDYVASITVRATDPYGSFGETVITLTAVADISPPDVTLSFATPEAQLGQTVHVHVGATDDVAVDLSTTQLTLASFRGPGDLDWTDILQPIPLDPQQRASVAPGLLSQVGQYRFVATVADTSGNTGVSIPQPSTLHVVDGAPHIDIQSPRPGQEIDQPIAVHGSIVDPQGSLVSYQAELLSPATLRQVMSPQTVTDAVGVQSGTLAVIDPTRLENGVYTLKVTANDEAGHIASRAIPIVISGRYKPGVFALESTDLEVSTSDLPLAITRRYSTANANHDGDFGMGWTLQLGVPDVEVQYVPDAPRSNRGQPMFVRGTRVWVTLPDGTREGFTFHPVPELVNSLGISPTWLPAFVPDPDNETRLSVGQARLALQNFGSFEAYVDFGSRAAFDPTDPQFGMSWSITPTGGQTIHVDAARPESAWMEDRNGNRTAITSGGITHWSGRSITIKRDGAGRIAELVDPAGATIRYDYDDLGRLIAVTDRIGQVTTYQYDGHDPGSTNFITSVTDDVGRRLVTARYHNSDASELNRSGRLAQLVDIGGVVTDLEFDVATRGQTTVRGDDQSFTRSNRDGNPIESVDPTGVVTRHRYDSSGNPIEQRQVVGDPLSGDRADDLVQSFEYNEVGLPIVSTDVASRSMYYGYTEDWRLETTVDPDGRKLHYGYDDRGNVVTVDNDLTSAVTLEYDPFGRLISHSVHNDVPPSELSYDRSGNVVSSRDGQDRVTDFEHDTSGRQTARVTRETDQAGNLVRVVRRETRYDAAGRTIAQDLVHQIPNGDGPDDEGFEHRLRHSDHTVYERASGNVRSTYRVNFGDQATSTAAPVAVADRYLVANDAALSVSTKRGVLANDDDQDQDVLSASLVDPPTHGMLAFLGPLGDFHYLPDPGFSGVDHFTYVARDSDSVSAPVQVTVEVLDAADPSSFVASDLTFDGSDQWSTSQAFREALTDHLIPIDPALTYTLRGSAKSGGFSGEDVHPEAIQYFGFANYDRDLKFIGIENVAKYPGSTDTRLSRPVSNGDTVLYLDDVTGWATDGDPRNRRFVWYGYSDSTGHVYPDYTYTRHRTANDLWDPAGIDPVNNTVTLRRPWWWGDLPAGTAVRNIPSPDDFHFAGLLHSQVPNQWTTHTVQVNGFGMRHDQFRHGAAYVRPGMIANVGDSLSAGSNTIQWRDVSFGRGDDSFLVAADDLELTAGVTGQTPRFGRYLMDAGQSIELFANFDSDPSATFQWTQLHGDAVSFASTDQAISSAQPSVRATDQELTFAVRVVSQGRVYVKTVDVVIPGTRVAADDRLSATHHRYDLRGNLIETRTQTGSGLDATWTTERSTHDSEGRVVWQTERYRSDSLGRPLADEPPMASKTIYDGAGRVLETQQWVGAKLDVRSADGVHQDRYHLAAFADTESGTLVSSSQTEYDSVGRVHRTRDADGLWTSTFYDRAGRVVQTSRQAIDRTGSVVLLTRRTAFDQQSRPILAGDEFVEGIPGASMSSPDITPPVDRSATASHYDDRGRRIQSDRRINVRLTLVDRHGAEVLDYDSAEGPFDIRIDDVGETRSSSYSFFNDSDQLIRTVNHQGAETRYQYDQQGRQIRQIGAAVETFDHTAPLRLINETRYGSQGRVSQTSTNIHGRDLAGRILIDARDAIFTRETFDAAGNSVSMTLIDGREQQRTFDADGRVTSETDSAGNTTHFEYDAEGRLTALVLPPVEDPLDTDGDGVLVGDSPRFEYDYDWAGNQTAIRDPLGRETTFHYDVNGRPVSRALPSGEAEEFTYDDRGREDTHLSFEGVLKRNVYDRGTTHLPSDHPDYRVGSGRLIEEQYFTAADVDAGDFGDPGEVHRHAYDANGRKVATEFWSAGQRIRREEWAYDARGRLVQHVSPEGVINHAFDPVTGRHIRTWTTKQPGRDAAILDDAIDDIRYEYNLVGWLTTVTVVETNDVPLPQDQWERTRYGYDIQGRRRRIDYPNGVIEVNQVDPVGRVTRITQFAPDPTPHDLGNNPLVSRFDYQFDEVGKRNVLEETFWFDDDGDDATPDVARTTRYEWDYDANGRLIRESIDHHDDHLDRTETFVMDLFGNHRERTVDYLDAAAVDETFQSWYDDNDRLTREVATRGAEVTQTDYGYTGTQQSSRSVTVNGELTAMTIYTYDLPGRMSDVITESLTDGVITARDLSQLFYDASGYRTSTTRYVDPDMDDSTDNWLLNNKTSFLANSLNPTNYTQTVVQTTTDGTQTPTGRVATVYGSDEVTQSVAQYDSGGHVTSTQTHTFLHDAHGSVRALAESDGRIEQSYTYSAYGQLLAIHNATGSPLGVPAGASLESLALTELLYSGESYDSVIDRQYLRARWYDPASARFNRLDPFAGNPQDPLSLNKYLYVHSDPIQGVDPTGQFLAASVSTGSAIANRLRASSASAVITTAKISTQALRLAWTYKWHTLALGALQHPAFHGQAKTRSSDLRVVERVDELAALAAATYTGSELDAKYTGQWRRELIPFLPETDGEGDTNGGFRAVVWKHVFGKVVVGMEGTDSLYDGITDAFNGIGIPTHAYRYAIKVADWAIEKYGYAKVEFTGHSLGGGLAAAAAYRTNRPATTFNAAGLHEITYWGNAATSGRLPFRKNAPIDNYYVAGEILSFGQNFTFAANAAGNHIMLPSIFHLGIGPGAGHRMSSVRDAIDAWRQEVSP